MQDCPHLVSILLDLNHKHSMDPLNTLCDACLGILSDLDQEEGGALAAEIQRHRFLTANPEWSELHG